MADERELGKDLEASLRQSKKLQGDTNAELGKSINLLSRINDLRDESIAKVKSLNKETINTQDIQKQITKATEKAKLAETKVIALNARLNEQEKKNADKYIRSLSTRQKIESDIEKARIRGNTSLVSNLGKRLQRLDRIIEKEESSLNIDERSLASALQSQKVAEETVNLIKTELELEKDIEKSIGLSGKVMGLFANKLGFAGDAYAKMVQRSRDLNDEGKKMSFLDKLNFLSKSIGENIKKNITDPLIAIPGIYKAVSKAGDMAGSGLSKVAGATAGLTDVNVVQKATAGVSNLVKNIPMIGGLLGGAVDMFASFLDLAIGASSQVQKMGRELGLSRKEAQNLNNQFSNFANNSNDVLLNSKKLFENQIELGKSLGVMNVLSNDRLQTDIHLKEIAGLELDTRTSLVESSVILGKNQKDIMNSVFAQVKGLKNATGIQLDQKAVLKEASSLGGYLGLSFAKYPAQLTKSLISIKAMGLELKQLDSIADSFLDFESSISNEFEAQLLTGRDINLSKARELFLNNDLAGAAQEITSQVGSASEFLSMNRIQAESMAKAFGMSRDQMGDMLKKQEYMSKIGAKDTDNAQKQYQLALAKYGTQKEMSEALGEETTQNIMNANAQEKIAGFMDKIKQGFVDLISNSQITGFIDKAIKWLSEPSNIQGIITKLQGFFHTVLKVTGSVIGGIMKFLDFLPGISIDSELIDTVSNLGDTFQPGSIGSLSNTKVSAEAAAATRSKAATANTSGAVVANVNMKTEYMTDPNNPAKMMYRIVNEDTGQKSDWQTGKFA